MHPTLPRLLWTSTLVAAIGTAPACALESPTDPLATMRSGPQPGCAVALIAPEGVRFDVAGLADVETGAPITPQSRFLIASASKQFTALAVLTLVDTGRIGIDEPAARWLPEMAGALQGATVRQLLNQTAGVRDHTTLMALSGVERLGGVAPSAMLAMMRGLETGNFPPGTRARYSNGNYLMLAQLVERVTGQILADYAAEVIFTPLGMINTSFTPDAAMTHGYRRLRDGTFRIADDQPSLPGSGGLTTTVEDLARFDASFRAQGPVWTENIRALFVEPGRLADGSVAILPEFGTPYGTGVGLEVRDGDPWLSHDGGSEGFRAEYIRRADAPRGAIVLCNRTDVNPGRIAMALLGVAPAVATVSGPPHPGSVPELAAPEARARLAGHWRSRETGIEYDIRTTDEGLQVTIRSPLAAEPVVEDWNGLSAGPEGELVTGPLRLKTEDDTLAVSFGARIEKLIFRRMP